MISQQKITFLMQLVLSAQETVVLVDEASRVGDEAKLEELKKALAKLNDEISRNLMT